MSDRRNMLLLLSALLVVSVSAFVEELDDTFLETKGADEIWLIKFYSPRCAICKQLDPVWHLIGSELKSLGSHVNVGRSDASMNPALAKEFQVRGYPTIAMLKKDKKYLYSGPRNRDAIMDFANRVEGPLVRSLSSLQLFQHAMSRRDVMFCYVGATSELKGNYTLAAEELIIHTYFFSASKDVLPKAVSLPSLPAVVVFKDGTFFTYSEDHDGDLKSWINRERFPNYFKIDSYTLYSMGETGKLVLLALVKSHCEESLRLKGLVEKVAAEYRDFYSRSFHFGFMEDTDYISGLVMGDVIVPSFIVVNLTNDGYFLPPVAMETERQLLDFMNDVVDGNIECQGGNDLYQRILRLIYDIRVTFEMLFSDAPLLGCFVIGFPGAAVTILVYFLCCKKIPAREDDDDDDDVIRPQPIADDDDDVIRPQPIADKKTD